MSDTPPTVRPGPCWFTRRVTDHRPALLQLPATLTYVAVDGRTAAIHRGVAWLPTGQRVVAVPVTEPVHVLAASPTLLLRDADGAESRLDATLDWSPLRGRATGLDQAATRGPAGWVCAGLELPEGARRAGRLQPFARGQGAVWADGGWLYRLRAGAGTDVVGPIATAEAWQVGPDGAVLVGDEAGWTRVAAPRSTMTPLAVALARGSVRWAVDGRHLTGWEGDEPSRAVRVDTKTGEIDASWPDALPTGDRRVVEPDDGSEAGTALLATDAVLHPLLDQLAGPGGQIWDLTTLTPIHPCGDEAPVPIDPGWAVRDEAHVLRVDARGERLGRTRLALPDEGAVGFGAGDHAAWHLPDGRVVGTGPLGPPRSARRGDPPGDWAWLGVDATLQVNGVRVGWSDDGLLIAQRG